MKKAILLFCMIFPLLSLAQQGIITSPLNPAFVQYHQQYQSGNYSSVSKEGHFLGYIPSPKAPVKRTVSSKKAKLPSTFPSSYDLRNTGWITSVKDQGGCGSCWTFATMSSIESGWKVLGMSDNDLSENNLKDCHGFDNGPCDGGNSPMSISYLIRQNGPVNESSDPYVDYPVACVTGLAPVSYEANARMVDNDINEIKQAIMDYGGLYTAFYWEDASYNSSSNTYYYNGTSSANHAVTLAGWDDTKVTAGGTGAWLIKNSWGTWWGQNGYFYISYNDSRVNSEVCYYPTKLTVNTASKVYNYSNLGECYDFGYGSNTAYGLIKFVTTNSYPLTRIGAWISNFDGTADIEVYDNFDGTTLSGLLATIPTQNLTDWGYYTFDLPNPVNLGTGNDFYIKVKYYTPNYDTPIPVEAVISGYSSTAVIQSGVCWASSNGTSWTAIGSGTSNPYDLCISAYTANEPPAPVTTAGTATACSGSNITIPLTVNGFSNITTMKLRLEYDPSLMTYSSNANANSSLSGMTVRDSVISSSLHAIMIKWKGSSATTLSAGSKLVDLIFNYISGSPTLSFNNTDHFGWDCQYTDSQRGSLYDNPVSTYYFNGQVTGGVSPVPTITGPATACVSTSSQTYYTESGMTNYTWTVSGGGNIVSGQGTNSVTVNWNLSGAQTISVNYTNSNGCPAAAPTVQNINIVPLPYNAGTVSGTPSVCAGDQNVSYWTDPVLNATTYVWEVPTGATIISGSGTNSITVSYSPAASSGIISVYGQDSCGNGNPSPDYNVTVNPIPPTPVISLSGNCIVSTAQTGNQWFNENGLISGATSQTYCPPSDPHTYYDIVTLNGCSSDTSNTIFYVNSGISGNKNTGFIVYPNPATSSFTIEKTGDIATSSNPELFNILGNPVKTYDRMSVTGNTHKWVFDCTGLPGGVYYIRVNNEEEVSKIIIKP
ncbi:MAG: C1 family peptidase [Bacteroidota bacterium]|nr:C1 family peptidase [Bacteroidota bacterium]